MVKVRLLKGQMIVEVVVAFAVMIIGLVAILRLSGKSVNSSGAANRTATATAYADEAMDWVRNEKMVNGWGYLFDKHSASAAYCLSQLSWTSQGSCGTVTINNTEYVRDLTLQLIVMPGTPRIISAKVVVTWTEAQRQETITRTYQFFESN